MFMNKKEIYNLLPHRYEWELLDQIIKVEPMKTATSIMNTTKESWYFKGHFPQYQIVPGVVLIEAMAHTAGIIFKANPEYKDTLGVMAGINKAKFRNSVFPGDIVKIVATLKNMKANLAIIEVIAYVGEKLVAEAELLVGLAKQ
jgi:3-hydroxyacyl-[acyl-carrier-protein] dehydratase